MTIKRKTVSVTSQEYPHASGGDHGTFCTLAWLLKPVGVLKGDQNLLDGVDPDCDSINSFLWQFY